MKAKLIGLTVGLILGLVFSLLSSNVAWAHSADKFDTETYYTGRTLTSWTRSNARTFARTVVSEPYNMLGGWWIDNNTEDPVDPVKQAEGTDCSGLLFKSWMLVHEKYVTGYRRWYAYDDTHGPYQAQHFYYGGSGCPTTCRRVCGSSTQACGTGATLVYMDAFVSQDHVATYDGKDAQGLDIILESWDPWVSRSTNWYRTTVGYIGIERYDW
jgi:hypothetical protein